jgi:hypothetical protein
VSQLFIFVQMVTAGGDDGLGGGGEKRGEGLTNKLMK